MTTGGAKPGRAVQAPGFDAAAKKILKGVPRCRLDGDDLREHSHDSAGSGRCHDDRAGQRDERPHGEERDGPVEPLAPCPGPAGQVDGRSAAASKGKLLNHITTTAADRAASVSLRAK